jgi:tight adherence protein B
MYDSVPLLMAVASAGLAAALWLPSDPAQHMTADPRPGRARWAPLAGVPVGAVLIPGLPAWPVVPIGIAAAALVVLWSLWTGRRSRIRCRALQSALLETCQQLSSELSSGQPPGRALEHAAELWAALAPAAEAFRVGADVPDALRQTGDRLGLSDLRLLAAAWHLAQRTGQGLAAPVERVVDQLLRARATRRVVDGELASARATARLVAALPFVALAMGSGAGAEPVAFLVATPAGWACLGAGLALGIAGLWWIEAIASDVERAG